MKRIYLLLLMILFSPALFSQPWMNHLPQGKAKSSLTFYDYRNAFEEYWAPFNVDKGFYIENGIKKKAAGWKQFRRWEYAMETQINPVTGEFPEKTAEEVYEEYLVKNPDGKSPASLTANWVSLGPSTSDGGYAGVGRLNCIAFHPSNTSMYWVGAASGGLWVTSNNGTSWSCLTDNNGVLAVSDVVVPTDFATSNTIYIATGDKDHWDNRSIGVLKTTNGGTTWNTTGITYALADYKMVYRLLIDPGNNQTLIAATSNGVFKTTNGGTTWSTLLTSTVFIDMEYKPGDFNTLYGSTTGGEIWYSSNGGGNWTRAFYDASAKRIELAVSANQPAWVYAIAAAADASLYGIYRSTSSGTVYNQVFSGTTSNLLGWNSDGSGTGGQGWYDLSLAAVPTNANTVLLGGVNTWRSTNGGTTWSIVNHWWGDGVPAAHADKHTLTFRGNGDLFECNDGGVYISPDNGTTWTDKTNGMIISQMYKLGISQTVSNETVTGLQDNGTKLLSGGAWSDVKGGDGMECLIDYTNVNIQYGTYVYGQISRTTDHWLSATDIEPAAAGNGAWVTPYIIDPVNPLILYAGYANVWKSTNRGDSWTQISTMSSSDKIRSMAIAPSNTQVLYVAALYNIWKTTNGGTSWTEITGTLPVGSGSITSIAVKNDDANTLWVTLSGYSAGRVYQSTNAGTSWTDLSAGLPSLPAYSIVQNKQSTSEVQLYVGTELGVYFKKGSANWIAYNTGLPNLKIGEIEIYYSTIPQNSKLRAASYGRGLWETPVYSVPLGCDTLNYLAYKAQSIAGTYTDLGSNGTVITTANFDDANSTAQNIGFSFTFNCQTFTQFVLNTNGFIKLGNTAPSTAALFFDGAQTAGGGIFNSTNIADINILSPFNHDLTSGTGTPEYRAYTSGTAPNRVCTIQFRNVRDKTTSPAQQYDNMQFQIKLFETTNIIQFVYGDWTASANASAFKTSACGLKGWSNENVQLLAVNKGSTTPWEAVTFSNANYSTTATLNFGNPTARPKPDAGRTYVFNPIFNNDLTVGEIYSMGDASLYFSNPQVVSVNIMNTGYNTQPSKAVTLTVSGANSFSDTKYTSALARNESQVVTFAGFTPTVNGTTNIQISLPSDDLISDNSKTWSQNTNDFTCNYSSTATPSSGWGYLAGGEGIFYAKYHITGTALVTSVKVYIYNYASNTGQTVFGMVLNGSGTVVGQSANYIIQAGDLGTWHTFTISSPPTLTNSDFYAGFGVRVSATDYYAMGIQSENPTRSNTYYFSDIDGTGLTLQDPVSFVYRYMIGAVLAAIPPVGGTATSNSPVCNGSPATLTLTGYTGTIQWQQSPTGSGSWTNSTSGTGVTSATYVTGNITATTYFRAQVSQPGYSPVYSTTATVTVTTCAGYAINGTFYYNNAGNTPLDLMWVRLKSNNSIVDSVQTNASGQFAFASKANGTYTISGRCTKPWSGINGTDALKIQRHFVGLEPLTEPVRLLAGDVNNSNSINGTDAVKVKLRFVGTETSFARGDWTFAKPVTGGDTVIVSGGNVTQNFFGLCVGDVNGSNTPGPGKTVQYPVVLASDGSVNVTPGQILDIPVRMMNAGQIGAVSLVLTYPGDLMTVENVAMNRSGLVYHINNNQVRLAWSDTEPLDLYSGDELLMIQVRILKDIRPGMTAELSLTDESELADGWGNPVPDAALSTLKLKSAVNNGATGNVRVFPNPASHEVNIEYELGKAAEVSVELASVHGQTLKTLTFSHPGPGKFRERIDLSGFADGVYLLKIRTGEETGEETIVKLVVSK